MPPKQTVPTLFVDVASNGMMRVMRDRQLIERIRRGDRDAAAVLVREHSAGIYRLLARLTRDTHAAEDLCQETFAAAWTGIGTFKGGCSLGTWLHKIAYRTVKA